MEVMTGGSCWHKRPCSCKLQLQPYLACSPATVILIFSWHVCSTFNFSSISFISLIKFNYLLDVFNVKSAVKNLVLSPPICMCLESNISTFRFWLLVSTFRVFEYFHLYVFGWLTNDVN
ncbi:hypothetical protein ACOSQ3_029375 [Xanthoceras sorbifolium]